MKISKILAGMSAAAIVASMAMIPASAAACEFSVSDDLAQIGKLSETKDLYAVYFNGKDEDKPNKDAIADLSAVYGASFTIKVDNNDWNTIGGGGSVNFNSTSGGWNAKDWAGGSWVEDDKPKDTLCYTTDEEGTYVLEYLGDAPVFAATDADAENFAAVGINNWAGDLKGIEIVGVKVLGADGNALYEAGSNKDKKEVQKKPVAEESSSKTDSTASGTDSKTDSKKDDSKTSSAAATSTAATSSKAGTTSTAATSSAAASDNVAATGATAGLALAGVALAGAAIVISKRK
ncbi:NPXTG-anchored protein [Ruminococcus bicirculans (ex Wegman et al. 2014)]|uniref:NPXTG-anchored protein n=1 Tax=Ruminococcus bicirculans (ex Wegman et al. 2014) TaxID=1160721 RepID=UPI003A94803F